MCQVVVAFCRESAQFLDEATLTVFMKATHCPLCYEPLEVRDVGPCMDCGFDPTEIEHARSGKHTYAEYRVFGDLSLVLCNFCWVDFASYDLTYFGLLPRSRIELGDFVREIQPVIAKDKCCVHCMRRLPFLAFVARAREIHHEGGNLTKPFSGANRR